MTRLSEEAKQLFVAELTAHSLIEAIDLGGALSAAFSVRHKVRQSEIETLLLHCGRTPADSHERVLSVAHLVSFAGAAYSAADLRNMCSCDGAALPELEVHPHYGGAAALGKACVSEPMNLWLGAAKENLQLNRQVLDPHAINRLTVGSETFATPQFVGNVQRRATPADRYVAAVTDSTAIRLAPAAAAQPAQAKLAQPGNPPPTLRRTLTPTSSELSRRIGAVNNSFAAVAIPIAHTALVGPDVLVGELLSATTHNVAQVNQHLRARHAELAKNLADAAELVEALATAGRMHYRELLLQLQLRGIPDAAVQSRRIDNARVAWRDNREALYGIVHARLRHLRTQSAEVTVDAVTHAILVPANFFLLKPPAV